MKKSYLGERSIERITPPEGWQVVDRSPLNDHAYYGIASVQDKK